jgi:hypothetical protein
MAKSLYSASIANPIQFPRDIQESTDFWKHSGPRVPETSRSRLPASAREPHPMTTLARLCASSVARASTADPAPEARNRTELTDNDRWVRSAHRPSLASSPVGFARRLARRPVIGFARRPLGPQDRLPTEPGRTRPNERDQWLRSAPCPCPQTSSLLARWVRSARRPELGSLGASPRVGFARRERRTPPSRLPTRRLVVVQIAKESSHIIVFRAGSVHGQC